MKKSKKFFLNLKKINVDCISCKNEFTAFYDNLETLSIPSCFKCHPAFKKST